MFLIVECDQVGLLARRAQRIDKRWPKGLGFAKKIARPV